MKTSNNNKLKQGALFSLCITSYVPLFFILIVEQLNDGWDYLYWGGWSEESIKCFLSHFGMSVMLSLLSITGIVGIIVLLHNLKSNLKNGTKVKVTKISNRNNEAIGYIATYIVPFLTSDFSKKLVKLYHNSGLSQLNTTLIRKMDKVCKRYGERIPIGKDGHIKINDRKDFETVVKAMCDYYKKGEVLGKSYGTFSGRELKEVNKS